jgi:hypothetical protein
MKVVYGLTYVMAFVFLVGETARRGIGYFSINATTMIEDYLCGAFLLLAAFVWFKKAAIASPLMAAAWGYATGGMFVPFAAHLEAWLRDETFRPDHPHADTASIIIKGTIWVICLGCLIVTLRNHDQIRAAA